MKDEDTPVDIVLPGLPSTASGVANLVSGCDRSLEWGERMPYLTITFLEMKALERGKSAGL